MKKIKYAFVGFGKSVHRYHLPFIDKTEMFQLEGYYKRGDKSFEMPYPRLPDNIKRFESIQEISDSDTELIIIATPPKSHYEYAKLFLKAGKNVLVDKPLCFTRKEAEELFSIAEKRGVKLLPYQNRRFDSDFMTFKNTLETYSLGKILEIESIYSQYRPDGADKKGDKYGGFVYDLGAHLVDQIISFFGRPRRILYDFDNFKNYVFGNGEGMEEGYIEDYFDIKFIYDKLRIRIKYEPLGVKEDARWKIRGSEAYFEKYLIDQQEKDLKKGLFPYDEGFGLETENFGGHLYFKDGRVEESKTIYGGYHLFYEEVYKTIVHGQEFFINKEETLVLIEILDKIVNREEYNSNK